MQLNAVGRRLLSEEAHDRLRAAIVSGHLPPGEVLRDGDLADQLGLSRAPVREALKRLVSEGLVVSKPQSYTKVAPLDGAAARDACAVVRAMHELATRVAVPLLTTDHLSQMDAANAAFAHAVRAADVDTALEADDALHDVLVAVSGNAALAATIERYTPLVRRLERRQFAGVGEQSISLHAELIDRCRAGDVDGATAVTASIFAGLERHLRTPA